MNKGLYYGSYLQLDKILTAQEPESFKPGNEPAHDEMLFIVIHQAYELWFKQILFELDYVAGVFGKTVIDDNSEDLNLVRHRLSRIIKILELLNQQVSILDTMTPLDFLEFRNLLTPSSGFQSVQFRLLEARLGLRMERRHQKDYYKRTNEGGFDPGDYATINSTEEQPTIIQLVNNWLQRMPFFEPEFWQHYQAAQGAGQQGLHPFWSDYRGLYQQGLTEREAGKIKDFDFVFFNLQNGLDEAQQAHLRPMLSAEAMQAALFIMLYRDFPVFQTSYQILDSLVEIDHLMASWRHKHLVMVRRMIGMRVGTGNTSGAGYLEGALGKHFVFHDISGLSTYLIERKKLPKLPQALIQQLGYSAMNQ
jgi:tryptophan 2,3-dioxygenase